MHAIPHATKLLETSPTPISGFLSEGKYANVDADSQQLWPPDGEAEPPRCLAEGQSL